MKHLKHLQLVITLLGLFYNSKKYGSSGLVWRRDPDLDGRIFLDEIQVLPVKRIECATACTRLVNCVSFAYDGRIVKCWLFDKIYRVTDSTVLSSPYTQYYHSTKGPLKPEFCPDGYIYANSICFKVEVLHISWLAAREVCLSDGGNLLVPDSKIKNEIISQYLNKDIAYYMGIHYINGFDIFEVVDGRTPSQMNYTNWSPVLYSNIPGNNLCGALQANTTGYFQWHSVVCSASPGFICEVKYDNKIGVPHVFV